MLKKSAITNSPAVDGFFVDCEETDTNVITVKRVSIDEMNT